MRRNIAQKNIMRRKICGRDGIPDGIRYRNWCSKRLVTTKTKKEETSVPDAIQLPSGN